MSDSEPGRRVFRFPWRTDASRRADLDEEFAFHLDMRCDELTARGMIAADARALALAEFGDLRQLREARSYIVSVDRAVDAAERRRNTMDTMIRSLRHAVRRLRGAPLFTITSVLTLTIGIGACAVMASLVSTVLLKPLPYGQPDRIEMIWGYYPDANLGFPEQPTSGRMFSVMRDNTHAYTAVAAFRPASFNLGAATDPERLDGVQATGEFFDALGVVPEIGRFFQRENELPGNDHVLVISDGLWRRRFGAAPDIVGRVVTLNDEPYTILGVAYRGFGFPRGSEMPGDFQFAASPDVWAPLLPPTRGPSDLAIVGRLRAGMTRASSRADMDRVIGAFETSFPAAKGRIHQLLVPLHDQIVGHVELMLLSLMAAVGLVLAIACVNTAQLLLAQLHVRRRELAMRAALGASSRRLAGEVLAEVLVLVAGGALGGIAIAVGAARVLRTFGASQLPRMSELTFDTRSAIAASAVTLLAALLAAIIPMLIGSRVSLIETLRGGGRGAGQRGMAVGARRALIVVELAVSLVLVASAGLLIRSLSHQMNGALGFRPAQGVTFELSLPAVRYPERQQRTSMEHDAAVPFIAAALDNIRAIPGVMAAAIGKPLPLSGAQEATVFTPEGDLPPLPPESASPIAEFTVASPDLFRALGTPLRAGRDFTSADQRDGIPVVIVNEAMADWLWPGKPAVGRRIRVGPPAMTPAPPWMTVVGVVSNMKRYALTETARPEMIVPYTQNPYPTFSTMQFVVRSPLAPAALIPAVRAAVATADAAIPLAQVRTIDELVATSSANARFVTRFMSAFGIVALGLAIVGVYGVIGYSVQQRRQEFGVRRALGAGRGEIVRLILRQSAALTAFGIAVGSVLAIAAGFGLRHLLFEVSPFDGSTFAGAVAAIVVATAAASAVPAIAASRIEPRSALEE